MSDTAEYEVFKGTAEARPFRLGCVRGFQRATELMYRMYSRVPGDYFIRDIGTNEIVASVLTPPQQPLPAQEPFFDIFRGLPDRYAVWIEAVNGLSRARDRMEELARLQPSRYFIFSRFEHSILARLEVAPPLDSPSQTITAA